MLAALNGNLDAVRKLVAGGARIDTPGWTPLIYAATGGHNDVVTFLAQRGANLDAASPNGTTALMMAVREHRLDTARLLIGRGADINHRNQDGATALSWAKRGNETDLEKELRRAGAKD
jgi:ankyrin repeat protein